MKEFLDKFYDYLGSQGLKNTPQRRLIVETFLHSSGHLTTEELYSYVRKKDEKIGQATVYRTLRLLCDSGIAKELHFGDGTARYEPVHEDSHHDHLICNSCGKNIEVVDDLIEEQQVRLAEKHGFKLTSHRMYLYGLCSDCQKTAPKKQNKSMD